MYAKYISENEIDYLYPNVLLREEEVIANPTDAMLLDAGYLPVTEEEPPRVKKGKPCTLRYERKEDRILVIREAVTNA